MIYADSIVLPRVLFTQAGLETKEIELDVQYTVVLRYSKYLEMGLFSKAHFQVLM